MFRKTLKLLKYFLLVIIIVLFFPRSIFPRLAFYPDKNDFDTYSKLNETEQRLLEFKDDDEALKLKLIQMDIINRSRARNGVSQVKLDILASRVANKICHEAAVNNYVGHWNMAGEKPYIRYGLAGGYDHVSENAYALWSSDNYDIPNSDIGSMMKSGHETFMAEKYPNDGHKINIIDKSHNFVGIGFYLSGNQFSYYEEFIDRYFEFENIPDEVKIDKSTIITVKPIGKNYIFFMMVYREDYPRSMTPEQIKRKGSYQDFTEEVYLQMPGWDLARYRDGSEYRIPLTFSKKGLYYIQIYYDKKELTKPATISTKGKTPASGIVIKVTS